MPRYVQDKHGKFRGSIGDGVTRVPTPSDAPSGLVPAAETVSTGPAYAELYAGFTARNRDMFPPGSDAAVVRDPATSPVEIDRVVRASSDPTVWLGAAENPTTTSGTLDYLSTLDPHAYEGITARAAAHRNAPESALLRFAAPSNPVAVRCNAAWNENSTADVLSLLEGDSDVNVLQGVADHKNASAITLVRLSGDPSRGDEWVHTAARANRSYPNTQKRVALASSPDCPDDVRDILKNDRSAEVRRAAGN